MNSTVRPDSAAIVDVTAAQPVPDGALDALLRPDEVHRADSFRRPDDRARFVSGRALLRVLIARWAGCTPDEVVLDARCLECGRPHGRPRPVQPAAAREVHTSVSHAGGVVLVAASHTRVGVDVEAWAAVEFPTFDEIALSPAEHGQLAAVPERGRGPARTRAWVQKEALLKVHGSGLTTSPATIDLGLAEHDRVVADPVRTGARIALAALDVGMDHCACLAVDSSLPPVIRHVNGHRLLATAVAQLGSTSR
jgi:4'-phosphopantetheinyl transferase